MKLMFCPKPKRPIDLAELAREVGRREGGKITMSAAQVSEAVARTLDVLAEQWRRNPKGVFDLLETRRPKPVPAAGEDADGRE